jgi:hypothetical protein
MMPGIVLDAESVRQESRENPHMTEKAVEFFAALDTDEINATLADSTDDAFWDAFDAVRAEAMRRLAAEAGIPLYTDEEDEDVADDLAIIRKYDPEEQR